MKADVSSVQKLRGRKKGELLSDVEMHGLKVDDCAMLAQPGCRRSKNGEHYIA